MRVHQVFAYSRRLRVCPPDREFIHLFDPTPWKLLLPKGMPRAVEPGSRQISMRLTIPHAGLRNLSWAGYLAAEAVGN